MFFLLSRYRQQEQFSQTDLFARTHVSDYLFVKCRLFASLTLNDHELALYDRMYTILTSQVPTPDIVVHLHAPMEVLLERIKQRGRSYEQDMDHAYLERLRSLYHNYFAHYEEAPLLEIDTTDVNFAQDDQAVQHLLAEISDSWQRAQRPRSAVQF